MRAAILLLIAVPAAADAIEQAQAIAKAGPEAARAAIPQLIGLGRGTPAERFAARDALAVAGPPAVAKLIVEAGGNPSLRILLEGVSFDLGAGVVVAALPALASEDPKVRAMAAVSLGASGPGGAAAVKMLDGALYDPDAEVRREAALALGGIGLAARDGIAGLIHLANDPERGMTREALLALGMIVRDAAERDRPAAKPTAEAAAAIEKGLAWLARQQTPDGWWGVPAIGDAPVPEKVRGYVASLALLAMLEAGHPDRHAPQLRAGLRYVVATDGSDGHYPWWITRQTVAAVLCATARILRDPEGRTAAEHVVPAVAANEKLRASPWFTLALLEAGYAGLLSGPLLQDLDVHDAGSVVAAIATGEDAKVEELRGWIASDSDGALTEPESWALAARARWYAGNKSNALVDWVRKRQREDGSWDCGDNLLGPVHTAACMLLSLEWASGLARPLTLPLPNAPQLKAAVATLKIARQSKDAAIRAAAEQALAGFPR